MMEPEPEVFRVRGSESWAKTAVMFLLLSSSTVAGLAEPVRSPCQLTKCAPGPGTAVSCTDVPAGWVVPEGLVWIVPVPCVDRDSVKVVEVNGTVSGR